MAFRGPYADGPSAADLKVESPPLKKLTWRDPGRLVVVLATVVSQVLLQLAKRLVRRGEKDWAAAASRGVIDAFEKLGPTFVKLGQVIASSPGLFPKPLADAALRCLDEVKPIGVDEVRAEVVLALRLQGAVELLDHREPRCGPRGDLQELRPEAAVGGVHRAGARLRAARRP
jgi:hypothetical protein